MHLVGSNTEKKTQDWAVIAIDGPAGAGKSTVARLLAAQLNYVLIDTGALYRSLALKALDSDLSLSDEDALSELCLNLKFRFSQLSTEDTRTTANGIVIPLLRVYCNDEELTQQLRTQEVGMAASMVSKLPKVRDALLELQRSFALQGGLVMEGRDIGTVIFPQADLKFYLDASVESRSRRRLKELLASGQAKSLEDVMRETKIRDEQDMNRKIAPLKKAPDALLIDSTQKSLEDVVSEMMQKFNQWNS